MATIFAAPGNNVSTTVGSPAHAVSDNFLNVASTSAFPALTGGQYYRVTVCQVAFAYSPTATTANYTIFKATGISGNQLTGLSVISTGLDATGNVDRVYNTGDIVEIRVTAGTLGDIQGAVNALEAGGGGGDILATLVNTPVSITGTVALTSSNFGKLHVCSGTSANYTVTLPAPVANKLIGFRMDPGLTKLVTISHNGSENIDGQPSRVMWANETVILGNDGTNWFKIAGKSLPMLCSMYQASGSTALAQYVVTPLTSLQGVNADNTGLMANTGSSYINILRTGNYSVSAVIGTAVPSVPMSLQSCLFTGASDTLNFSPFYNPSMIVPAQATGTAVLVGTAGSYFQAGGFQATQATVSTFGTTFVSTNISVTELISW